MAKKKAVRKKELKEIEIKCPDECSGVIEIKCPDYTPCEIEHPPFGARNSGLIYKNQEGL